MLVQLQVAKQTEKAYNVTIVYNNDFDTKQHYSTWMPKSVVLSVNENNTAEVKDWFLGKLAQEMSAKRLVANFRNEQRVFSL